MATTLAHKNPRWYLRSLEEYVLVPLDSALEIVDREAQELHSEREALKEFRDAVVAVEPVQHSADSLVVQSGEDDSPRATVRDAFIDTFFSVDHYERVYGEEIMEGISEEFGLDFAVALQPNSGIDFSPTLRDTLVSSIEHSIEERQSLWERVQSERQWITSHRQEIRQLLDTLDSSVVPEWFREEMNDRIQAILEARQQELNKPTRPFDNHEFRAYLYQSAEWTYPVLTAIARLQESITLE